MKKLSLLFAIVLAFAVASQAQIKIGAKAGVNINNMAFDYANSDFEPETKMGLGFHFGATAEYGISDQIAVQSGLLFTRKGFSFDIEEAWGGEGVDVEGYDRMMVNYLEIPIHAAYKFGGFQVYAGPYFAFGIGGKNKWDVTVSGDGFEESDSDETSLKPVFGEVDYENLDEDESPYRAFDAGLNFGIGYQMDKLLINAGYSLGLVNTAPSSVKGNDDYDAADQKSTHRVISVSVSYFFLDM